MNLANLFTFAVVAYGALSLTAAVAGMMEDGARGPLFVFVIAALVLIATPWMPHNAYWLLCGLVGLHLAAIWQGLAQDDFHWQHHAIRGLVSIAILGVFMRIK